MVKVIKQNFLYALLACFSFIVAWFVFLLFFYVVGFALFYNGLFDLNILGVLTAFITVPMAGALFAVVTSKTYLLIRKFTKLSLTYPERAIFLGGLVPFLLATFLYSGTLATYFWTSIQTFMVNPDVNGLINSAMLGLGAIVPVATTYWLTWKVLLRTIYKL